MLTLSLQPVSKMMRAPLATAGFSVILLALATHLFQWNLGEIFTWLDAVFGPVFIAIYLLLCVISISAALRLENKDGEVWYELGSQSAGGIATLALTFTLLGISLGIESLAQRELSPETVGAVISDLTRHFSTAFLTTIVGLPTANLLRAWLAVRWTAITTEQKESS